MEVKLDNKKIKLNEGSVVLDLLKKAKINPETVLVMRKKELISEKDILRDKDILETVKVVSGG